MKKFLGIIMISMFTIIGTTYSQYLTISAKGGESSVNWSEIMSEYESPDYDGPPFWYACINAPQNAKASSTLSPQGKYNYYAKNLNDNDPRTAWVEGKSDYGIGEYFSVQGDMFGDNTIYIFNGYQHSYSSWKNNSRVKKFRVYADDRAICYLDLQDKMGGQYFNLPNDDLYGKWIRFEIVEVYKGEKWNDVAISEIHTKGCCFNTNTNILNFDQPLKIEKIQNGNEIASVNIATDKIKETKVIRSAKQIHHTLLKISTKDHTVELTPSHPLFVKEVGLISLYNLKRDLNFSNYNEMLGEVEILVWNSLKQKTEYQKLAKVDILNGNFETHTILKLDKGETYIANGFVTSVY
tara:strand:- start:187 stop:1242 length:1056 start_codon:yes stop_codon:yes gene_type:complete